MNVTTTSPASPRIMSARRDADRAHYVEQMAIAICNKIRARHGLEPVRDLHAIEDSELYRILADAALVAYFGERRRR